MVKTYTLKREELATVRSFGTREARRWGGRGNLSFEPGTRINLDDASLGSSINVLLVSRDPTGNWDDTDLHDHLTWADMRRPIPLTEEGRAIVDLYISNRDELICNVQAEIDEGGLAAIHADANKNLWKRD